MVVPCENATDDAGPPDDARQPSLSPPLVKNVSYAGATFRSAGVMELRELCDHCKGVGGVGDCAAGVAAKPAAASIAKSVQFLCKPTTLLACVHVGLGQEASEIRSDVP